jgi:hypothetical protein
MQRRVGEKQKPQRQEDGFERGTQHSHAGASGHGAEDDPNRSLLHVPRKRADSFLP